MPGSNESPAIVNDRVLENEAAYAQSFASARPFRHVVIDHFLSEEFCRDICRQFPRFDEQQALNEDGFIGGKAIQERVHALGPAYLRLDEAVQQASFLSLFEGDHEKVDALDRLVGEKLGFPASYGVSGQTYSRKVDYALQATLAGAAASVSKMGHDLRLLAHLRERTA